MKILYLSDDFPPDNLGGAGVVAHNLAKAFKELGHDIYVVSTTQDKSKEGSYVQDGFKIYKIYSRYHRRWRAYFSLYNPQTVKKVSKIIADIKPDVIHAHNVHYHLSYHCLKIAKDSGARVILTAHDTMLYSYGKVYDGSKIPLFKDAWDHKLRFNPLRNLIIKYYLRNVDKIAAVSDALRRALINNGIKNVETIHNGINLDDWMV